MEIKDGERVKVSSRRGEIQIKAKISRKVNRGVVFIPFHFAETAANVLTNSGLRPRGQDPGIQGLRRQGGKTGSVEWINGIEL